MYSRFSQQEESIHVAHLEGLASIGLIKRSRVEECMYPNMGRIVAETVDGKTYITKCVDARGLRKVIMYLQYALNLSNIIVEGTEENGREKQR